ncbi:MAG: hypothetical protein IPL38_07350 [Rhodobacter sp.]|nr:hypothetical protein [Rhodobacter sp.]MBK8439325.1 hypothetical protein [Rhodobacter sp.]
MTDAEAARFVDRSIMLVPGDSLELSQLTADFSVVFNALTEARKDNPDVGPLADCMERMNTVFERAVFLEGQGKKGPMQ